jgi:prefoldin subunit 5
MNRKQLDNVSEYVNRLCSRIDYIEDEIQTLKEAIVRLENIIRSLQNPFSRG